MSKKCCSVEGCAKRHLARGYCRNHYMQERRGGRLFPQVKESDEAYLLNRIKVNSDGCWLWQKSTYMGYGRMVRHGKNLPAHVFSFVTFVRSLMPGEQVNHKCHVRSCCNPEHLYAGDQKQNMADMQLAGRARYLRGSEIANSRIDEQTAKDIFESGGIAKDAARKHGVSISLIYAIRKKQIWKHIHEQPIDGQTSAASC